MLHFIPTFLQYFSITVKMCKEGFDMLWNCIQTGSKLDWGKKLDFGQ